MSSTTRREAPKNSAKREFGSVEAKMQQRKLNALKVGVHRISDVTKLVGGIHVIGVGGAGVKVVEQFLSEAPEELLSVHGSRLTALAVDIGDSNLKGVRQLAGKFDDCKSLIETLSLENPEREALDATLSRYHEFMALESPFYLFNPDSKAWLQDVPLEQNPNGSFSRAVAKAVYARAYHDGERPIHKALKRFARSVEETGDISVVCIIFGLADSTGSGIAIELARNLSNAIFGRRVLIAGVGILPHNDETNIDLSNLHTTLTELDVLCDENKNKGITISCGDQYKNPFTAGFMAVQQLPWVNAKKSREIVNASLASFLAERRGANLWETLRLLNWVAAPATQHPAARTPWGNRWIHMLAFHEEKKPEVGLDVRNGFGLVEGCVPEVIEMRTSDTAGDDVADAWVSAIDSSLKPQLPTQRAKSGSLETISILIPRLTRKDLLVSEVAWSEYKALPIEKRKPLHGLLLEQGLYLCEPSTRLQGMAGASVGSGSQWISVPMCELNCDSE